MSETEKLKVSARWTNDCSGKKDFDGRIVDLSTRYWPRGGGFYTSVDGQTWTRLAEKVTHKAQTDVGDRYDVTGAYRYVRVTGFGNTTNAYTLHLQELAVYDVT